MAMTTEHHGYLIDYNENTEKFRAYVDGAVAFESPSLGGLKVQIERFEKNQNQKGFKRFKVWISNWRFKKYDEPDGFVEGEVTSITEQGDYWVSVGGKRTKECTVVDSNEINRQKIKKIAELQESVSRIQSEIHQLDESLDRLSKGAVAKKGD